MTRLRTSRPHGVLKDETTATQRVTPSTNAGNPSISVTLASTVPQNPTSPPIQHLPPANPNAVYSRIIQVFGEKLVKLGMAEWRKIELGSGKQAFALCFLTDKWLIDPVSKELTPL
jgi:hypothetical protein